MSATPFENSRQAVTWSWAAADADTLVKTPKEMLPEDLNVRVTVTYEAESHNAKGFSRRWSTAKQTGNSFQQGRRVALSTGLAQVYALRF